MFFSVNIIVFDTGLKNAVLGQCNLDRYDFYLISKGYISKPLFQSEAKCESIDMKMIFLFSWPSSFFFSVLAPSDRPKFLAFTKKKGNEVVQPFFT